MDFRYLSPSGPQISEITYGNLLTHGSQVENKVATQDVRAAHVENVVEVPVAAPEQPTDLVVARSPSTRSRAAGTADAATPARVAMRKDTTCDSAGCCEGTVRTAGRSRSC